MRFLRIGITVCIVVGNIAFASPAPANALQSGIVIAQVQAGGIGDATQEFVSLYNNSEDTITMTDWCLVNKSDTRFACIDGEIQLESFSYFTLGSASFADAYPYYQLDVIFDVTNMSSGSIVASSDTISLVASGANDIDSAGWTSSLSAGSVLERQRAVNGCFLSDGALAVPFVLPTDCVPASESVIDICTNIDDTQTVLSADMEVDDNGHCYLDACTNLPDIQETIPAGFEAGENGTCGLNILPIEITELLPNPDGDDRSNEFIELYNPNDTAVDTTYHVFHLNGDYNKTYGFPAGLIIEPHSYLALYNRDIAFTLTNSTGSLRLRTLDNIHVYDVAGYNDAESGQAWALIGGVWQYTTIPTPGAENEVAPADMGSMAGTKELADCGEGRERNPTTNRCRAISTATSSLAACNIDQYRNPDTGRCRKIATTSLASCKDGQYRSEETGRCRNLPASSVPNAGFAVQPIQEAGKAFVGWWALGGVSLLAAGYAGWEWRRELAGFWKDAVNRFR